MSEERMTVRQLSKAAGVSVASIKYYTREGLLPAGDSSAEHRAHYDDGHLDRLRLIRALRDVGKLPIATISAVFDAMAQGGRPFSVVARALDAMASGESKRTRQLEQARSELVEMLGTLGVEPRANSGALQDLALALVRLREIRGEMPVQSLLPYAESALALAQLETEANQDVFSQDTATLLRTVVLGTVLFEPVLLALRRVMHEDLAKELLSKKKRPRR
jgi:DNA-binding transcriptional MerR regulator